MSRGLLHKVRALRKLAEPMRRWAMLALGVFVVAHAGLTNAQSSTASADDVPSLTFDWASIRESAISGSYTMSFTNPPHASLLILRNNPIMNMIVMAYDVPYHGILDAPEWVGSARYTIEAKSDSAVDEKLARMNDQQARLEKQHMLQVLLADRFQLEVRRDTRKGRIYNLVTAKNGPKMSTDLKPPTASQVAWFHGEPVPPLYQFGDGSLGYEFVAHGATTGMLASELGGQLDTSVIDKTGLTGKYDFVLQYDGTVAPSSDDPDAWSPLVTALPKQLGLKLEPAEGPVDVLVIEHIERPSPN